LKITRHVDVAF